MVKIIEPGTIKRARCPICGCLFSYEPEDISGYDEETKEEMMKCPQCGCLFRTTSQSAKCLQSKD